MDKFVVAIVSCLGGCGIALVLMLAYYNNIRILIKDVLSFFAASFGWFKSTSTKLSIETNGTKSIDNLNRIVPELGLPELSIEWVKTDEHGQVRLEPGKAIVLLKYNKDNTQNIINTTAAYVHKTLLHNSKPFMDKGIQTAIDFSVIREFLNNTPQKNYVVSQFAESCSDDFILYGDAFNKVLTVEDEGLLTRLLLREYAIWGNKLAGKIKTPEYEMESKRFLDFVYSIATREFDELTPLVHKEKTIKIAILLVAKYDTYAEKGIEPYIRRIKEEFAGGVNTFYLLARNDKINILNHVYGEIISSGNYNLLNGPEVYKDNVGRDNICYCIEVKPDADMAKAYNEIQDKITDENVIEVTITKVYKDEVKGEYGGLTIIVPRNEITDSTELRLKNYYVTGMTIEVIPLKVIDKGEILCSMKHTNSNPKELFNNRYEVGSTVIAIVENADDDYINLRIKDTNQQCIAYRRDLTFSRFTFLHKLFPVGNEYEFTIKDIEYVFNKLVLRYNNIKNPWENLSLNPGDEVSCEIYNIKETCYETELGEGLFAILPYSELSWLESDIEMKKKTIKRSSKIHAHIKKIVLEEKLIILTCKEEKSPYITYFETLDSDNKVNVQIISSNSYGVIGVSENHYKVFIPISETYIGPNKFKYKIGRYYPVKILKVNDRFNSLIGSFRPFITHPLQRFSKIFYEGQVLSHLQFIKATDNGAYFSISYGRNKKIEALLLNRDVSNWCYIKNLDLLFRNKYTCPMILKEINLERNVVFLSIKDLSLLNKDRVNSIAYGDEYNGVVMGRDHNNYSILIEHLWTEVQAECNSPLQIGAKVKIIKASSSTFVVTD